MSPLSAVSSNLSAASDPDEQERTAALQQTIKFRSRASAAAEAGVASASALASFDRGGGYHGDDYSDDSVDDGGNEGGVRSGAAGAGGGDEEGRGHRGRSRFSWSDNSLGGSSLGDGW